MTAPKHTFYEWDIETVDLSDGLPLHSAYADILDHCHSDDCPGIPEEHDQRLCLVRDHDFDVRSWAYVMDGKLEAWFRDAYGARVAKVPQRFHRELERSKGA